MNPTNTEMLIGKYPRLYRGVVKSPRHSLMCFGFECGDGWSDLLDRLSAELTALCPDAEAVQVKEKFGGLRFYTGGLSDGGHEIVQKYEEESYRTCESCGEPGSSKNSTGYWIRTLCKECADKNKAKEIS